MSEEEFEVGRSKDVVRNEAHRVTWGPVAAILVTIGSFFLAQIFVGALLALSPFFTGKDIHEITDFLQNNVLGQFVTILVVEGLIVWLVWQFLRYRKARFKDMGFIKPESADIWRAIAWFVVYFIVLILIMQLASRFVPSIDLEQEQQIGFDKKTTGMALIPVFASLVLIPPFVEEVLFRGFLYTGLRSRLSLWVAGFITCTIFALAHLQVGSGNAPLWVAALDTFVLSVILVHLREETGSLWPPIGVHMLKNGLAFMVLFVWRS